MEPLRTTKTNTKEEQERENELLEKQEELQAQKEELTAAIEELVLKNNYLSEAMKQLQKRNEELDLLLYRSSHDLRSPVASLQGLLHFLSAENLTEDQRQMLGFMEDKVSQMNDVLKSLNMLSEAAFQGIAIRPVKLSESARQVLSDLKYLPNFQHVALQFEYNGLEIVNTDELVLYNILKCLISNAIIFRNPVDKGKVTVAFQHRDNNFIIEVSDDGEGISAEIGGKIFNMFFRGSDRSHGAGLGLYIVKTVVERLHGEVRWISKPGNTMFQVVLPG